MSLQPSERWRALLQNLDPETPPADMGLYVRPKRSCADAIVSELLATPGQNTKFLLVGARGGGKSTELRAIGKQLKDKMTLVEIDLDRSGVVATSVSAYDLLYIASLALLRHVPDEEEAKALFDDLADRYAGGDKEARKGLGDWKTALQGVAGFATTAAGAAIAMGLEAGLAPAAGALFLTASQGLRLLSTQGFVSERSPQGRSMQESAVRIAQAAWKHQNRRICVLIDGLERMNGEAGERFRQVFEQTRLLADASWAAVIAAPPCTVTETNSVDGRGFFTKPVWGFGSDDLASLREVLERRFLAAGVDPARDVMADGLKRMVNQSGGLPRHAIRIMRAAALQALSDNAPRLESSQIDAALQAVAQELGRGLTAEHLRVLIQVHRTMRLPGGPAAATLFADGRILVYPPDPGSSLLRWVVHPLLGEDIEREAERHDV